MAQIEKAIQAALIAWVKATHPTIIITTTANERSFKETSQIGSLGIPDLILFSLRGVLLLELKTTKGKLNKNQIKWNAGFDKMIFYYPCDRAVAHGFIEAKKIIDDFCIAN